MMPEIIIGNEVKTFPDQQSMINYCLDLRKLMIKIIEEEYDYLRVEGDFE